MENERRKFKWFFVEIFMQSLFTSGMEMRGKTHRGWCLKETPSTPHPYVGKSIVSMVPICKDFHRLNNIFSIPYAFSGHSILLLAHFCVRNLIVVVSEISAAEKRPEKAAALVSTEKPKKFVAVLNKNCRQIIAKSKPNLLFCQQHNVNESKLSIFFSWIFQLTFIVSPTNIKSRPNKKDSAPRILCLKAMSAADEVFHFMNFFSRFDGSGCKL